MNRLIVRATSGSLDLTGTPFRCLKHLSLATSSHPNQDAAFLSFATLYILDRYTPIVLRCRSLAVGGGGPSSCDHKRHASASPIRTSFSRTLRLQELIVVRGGDLHPRLCKEHYYGRTDWGREKRASSLCSANIQLLAGERTLPLP